MLNEKLEYLLNSTQVESNIRGENSGTSSSNSEMAIPFGFVFVALGHTGSALCLLLSLCSVIISDRSWKSYVLMEAQLELDLSTVQSLQPLDFIF